MQVTNIICGLEPAVFLAPATLEDRVTLVMRATGRRAYSFELARRWLEWLSAHMSALDAESSELVLREALMLAPLMSQADELYDMLMSRLAPPPIQANGGVVFMITSCRKYFEHAQRVQRDLRARGATACIVIGDPSLRVARWEADLCTLAVPDTYEALPHKVAAGVAAIVRRYGPKVAVVKIDDDNTLGENFDVDTFTQLAGAFDYVGSAIVVPNLDRFWHIGKTQRPMGPYTRRYHGPWASGPCYLLSPRSAGLVAREHTFYPAEFADEYYEDKAMGDFLRRQGIFLHSVSLESLGIVFDLSERFVSAPTGASPSDAPQALPSASGAAAASMPAAGAAPVQAAPAAAANEPLPTTDPIAPCARPDGINMVLLTVRSGPQARSIIEAAAACCRTHSNVRLTLAYGGDDEHHAAWLSGVADTPGADIMLLREPSIAGRLALSLDPDFGWTLFLADDDPFTVNYLDAFVEKAAHAGPQVSAIAPSIYLGVGPALRQPLVRQSQPIGGADAGARLAQLFERPDLAAVLFYALVRTPVVMQWQDYVSRRPHVNSYADQLLNTLMLAAGDLEVVDGCSVLLRDESNWIGHTASTQADARFYPSAAMVHFHELFWVADLARMLRSRPDYLTLLPALRVRMQALMKALLDAAGERMVIVPPCKSVDYQGLLIACRKTLQWLQETRQPQALAHGLELVVQLAQEAEAAFAEAASGQAAQTALAPAAAAAPAGA